MTPVHPLSSRRRVWLTDHVCCGLCAGIALHKLARCYERGKDLDAAARCYEANLARIDAEQLQGQDAPDALLFLATYKKVCHYGT